MSQPKKESISGIDGSAAGSTIMLVSASSTIFGTVCFCTTVRTMTGLLVLVCFGIFALPTANALNRLLRRQGSNPSFPERQTLELPDDLDSLFSENSQALLAELMGQTSMIGFSLTALSVPTTTTTPQEPSGCHSAYVYCGQGISTCSLDGGWMIDVSAVHRESGFHLQAAIGLGLFQCARKGR